MVCDECIYFGVEIEHLRGYGGFDRWHDCEYPLPYFATPAAVPKGLEIDCKIFKRRTDDGGDRQKQDSKSGWKAGDSFRPCK